MRRAAEDAAEWVKRFVADQLDVSLHQVKPESRLREDFGADSLDLTELLMCVEDEWELFVEEEDPQWKTVADITACIEAELKKG